MRFLIVGVLFPFFTTALADGLVFSNEVGSVSLPTSGLTINGKSSHSTVPELPLDTLIIPTATTPKLIEGLSVSPLADLDNTDIMNALLIRELQFSKSHTANLEFPCGKYMFGDTIKYQLKAVLSYTLTIKIPACTTLSASSNLKSKPLFKILSSDLEQKSSRVCFYGGNSCISSDQTLGGKIDLSQAQNISNPNDPAHGNVNGILVNNAKEFIVQGLMIVGDEAVTDTLIAGKAHSVSIRDNILIGATDAAVYLSGVTGEEESKIYDNQIENTRAGIVCKRGFGHCKVYTNYFINNGNDVAGVRVDDSFSINPYPAMRMTIISNKSISTKNNDVGSWSQFALLDWCTNCYSGFNTIQGRKIGHRLINTQDTIIESNTLINVDVPFTDTRQKLKYGDLLNSRPSLNNLHIP